jgi:hypothetical protein
MPDRIAHNEVSWREMNPSLEVTLWDNTRVLSLGDETVRDMLKDARADYAVICDRLRFLILEKFGGLYVDIDSCPLRPLGGLLESSGVCAIAGTSSPAPTRRCDPSAIASEPHLPAIQQLLGPWYARQRRWPRGGAMGEFLRRTEPRVVIWPSHYFCGHQEEPGAYALHWPNRLGSWRKKHLTQPPCCNNFNPWRRA